MGGVIEATCYWFAQNGLKISARYLPKRSQPLTTGRADVAEEKQAFFRSQRHARQSSPASERGLKTAPIFFARNKMMALLP